jgi:mannose/fructose/N-acetylgalactosamine-specific phosphotransferase system component IIB
MKELEEDGKVSTRDWYRHTLRSMILFVNDRVSKADLRGVKFEQSALASCNKINISQITSTWLRRYEKHLLREYRHE